MSKAANRKWLPGSRETGEENCFNRKKVNKLTVDTHWRNVCSVGYCCEVCLRLLCHMFCSLDTDASDESSSCQDPRTEMCAFPCGSDYADRCLLGCGVTSCSVAIS